MADGQPDIPATPADAGGDLAGLALLGRRLVLHALDRCRNINDNRRRALPRAAADEQG